MLVRALSCSWEEPDKIFAKGKNSPPLEPPSFFVNKTAPSCDGRTGDAGAQARRPRAPPRSHCRVLHTPPAIPCGIRRCRARPVRCRAEHAPLPAQATGASAWGNRGAPERGGGARSGACGRAQLVGKSWGLAAAQESRCRAARAASWRAASWRATGRAASLKRCRAYLPPMAAPPADRCRTPCMHVRLVRPGIRGRGRGQVYEPILPELPPRVCCLFLSRPWPCCSVWRAPCQMRPSANGCMGR